MKEYVLKRLRKNNMKNIRHKKLSRIRRYTKLRKKIKSFNVFRLVVHRSSKHIYAQIINSNSSNIITCASTLEQKDFFIKEKKYTGNKFAAGIIGKLIAERALRKGVEKVSFDRSGFKYHGRIKSLAESARLAGLLF